MMSNGRMDTPLNVLAMRIFVQMAAQHTTRHGVHESRRQASSLAQEAFKLAEAFEEEREARTAVLTQSDRAEATPA